MREQLSLDLLTCNELVRCWELLFSIISWQKMDFFSMKHTLDYSNKGKWYFSPSKESHSGSLRALSVLVWRRSFTCLLSGNHFFPVVHANLELKCALHIYSTYYYWSCMSLWLRSNEELISLFSIRQSALICAQKENKISLGAVGVNKPLAKFGLLSQNYDIIYLLDINNETFLLHLFYFILLHKTAGLSGIQSMKTI